MMIERSFPGLSNLKFFPFIFVFVFFCIFAFLFVICLCLLVGPHPPNGYNPPLREEDFICVTCFVLFCFVFVYWLEFFVLTCLLYYVL
jgi:hypothetical protein